MKTIAILLICASFFFSALFVNAQEISSESEASSPSSTITVAYDLPYPGMLPDSPFYKIKVLRDKIITFLISNPQKKIDFYLLQADKGVRASSMLVDKNSIALAKETALKAEHNMTLIPEQLRQIEKKPDDGVFDRLETASKKHQEIFLSILTRTKGDDRKTFGQVLSFSEENLRTIEKYHKKSPKKWGEWD